VAEATFAGANGLLAYNTDGNCDADDPLALGGCPGIYIEVANPRRPEQRRAITSKCCVGGPVWSPDGKRLLYDNSQGDIGVSCRDGSRKRRVVIGQAADPA